MARVKLVFKLFAPILFSGGLLSPFSMASTQGIDAIKPFPNAKIDIKTDQQVTSHPIVSSSMKKVNGVVTADSQQWLDGLLNRRLYLLPDGKSSDQAFKFFTDQFKALGVNEVFSCDRFSCGGSNFWANNIFDISKLYGLDKEQAYFLGIKSSAKQDVYYLTYTVKRGNRREYALVDVFTFNKSVKPSSAVNGATIDLLTLPQSEKAYAESELVGKITRFNPENTWLITLQSSAAGSLPEVDQQVEALNRSGSALKAYLVGKGFSEDKIRIQTVVTKDGKPSVSFSMLKN